MQTLQRKRKILVAPLDWGLGHATRCVPVVHALLAVGCEVVLATAGAQEALLRAEFPQLQCLHLPGYGVRYGKHGAMGRLLLQLPTLRRHIFTEHAWLQRLVALEKIDGIISDNRYGLYHSSVPSVLITHQLALQLPTWAGWAKGTVQEVLYRHIAHFDACWVPDVPDTATSLGGLLSHPPMLPQVPVHYIGWLSRLAVHADVAPAQEGRWLISLSGPEPQRTLLEQKILAQLTTLQQPAWLLRGLPGQSPLPTVPPHVQVHNHLPAALMAQYMQTCSLLVSRSGYSTLMDAALLGTPVACIPTPGQTEQVYLARRLHAQQWGYWQPQQSFDLHAWLQVPPRRLPAPEAVLLQPVVDAWVQGLG